MKHLTEEQLVSHYYRDADDPSATCHLENCEICRSSFQALAEELALLKAVAVPEPAEGYEEQVWRKLQLKLDRHRVRSQGRLIRFPHWARIAAVACLVAAAFLAGRFWPERGAHQNEPVAQAARDRILLVKVADHLERSQVALVELVHAEANGDRWQNPQSLASDLVATNRLYRQTAWQMGERNIAAVLEDLERVLQEIANSPEELSGAELQRVRHQIEDGGIIFKIRILGSLTRTRETDSLQQRDASNL